MRVVALETLQLAEFPFLFWLRVHTDAGIIGTGETFWAPGPVASYIHDNVASYLLGKDPRDIELHDSTLGSVYVGARDSGAEVRGNSAVNIALWDIYGQALGEPVWRLLGGRTHRTVPIYNTCAGYKHVRATKKNALFERGEDWSLGGRLCLPKIRMQCAQGRLLPAPPAAWAAKWPSSWRCEDAPSP